MNDDDTWQQNEQGYPESDDAAPVGTAVGNDEPAVDVLAPTEPPQAPVDTRPRVTARAHFAGRTNDPIIAAFLHCEKLYELRTRKLVATDWEAALHAFRTAERR